MAVVSLEEAKRLGKELLTSRANVNNAPKLLDILNATNIASSSSSTPEKASKKNPSNSSIQCRLEALNSLHAFFVPLFRTGNFFSAARKKAKMDLEVGAPGGEGDGDGKEARGKKLSKDKAEAVYRLWVCNKYRDFKKSLFKIVALVTNPQVLQIAAINTLMDLVRDERVGEFNNGLYLKICGRMVGSKGDRNKILEVLIGKYFKYNDVRYYTYTNMEKIVMKRLGSKQKEQEIASSDDEKDQEPVGASLHTFARNVYDVLSNLPPALKDDHKDGNDAEELWTNSSGGQDSGKASTEQGKKNVTKYKDTQKQKQVLSRAWLSLLQLSLPLDVYKKVLARLPRNVIPYMTNPHLLSDFLTESSNIGGLISVMALGSLYILMEKYGLEYSDIYNKLYALLEPSIFVARYRSRFFELLDTCLKSTHLQAYLVAAFVKRLGRLVLSAPPSGAIVVIALIHNLLRRHPSINVLVHRGDENAASTAPKVDSGNGEDGEAASDKEVEQKDEERRTTEGSAGADPFIATEADIIKCNALKSSLWEMESLRRHYCPAVSRFVESLENDLTNRPKTTYVAIQDFSATSYATIFQEEVGRRIKSVPMAFYASVPSTLFPENNLDGSFEGWRFGGSVGLNPQSLQAEKVKNVTPIIDTGKELEDVDTGIEEDGDGEEDSIEDTQSEVSSDDSGGSRSRSEESEDDLPQPLLKRLRGT